MVDEALASSCKAPVTLAENVCLVEEFNIYKDVVLRKFGNECDNNR